MWRTARYRLPYFRSWEFAVPMFNRWKSICNLQGAFEDDGTSYRVLGELYWIDNGTGWWQVEATSKGVWGDSRQHSART
jgi:hypothetical protein